MENADEGNAARPPRRPRRAARRAPVREVSASEEESEASSSQEEEQETKTPKKTRRSKRTKQENEEDNHSDEEVSTDSDSEEETPRLRRRRRSRSPNKTGPPGRGKVEKRTCPHCGDVKSTAAGLKYHIDHFVCRPELKGPNQKKRGRGQVRKDGNSSNKRFRGSLEDRTCSSCNKVFTSVVGLEYHAKKKVCQKTTRTMKKAENIQFHTLAPGSKFITMFGIVEVVKDDRAVPTGKLTEIDSKKERAYQSKRANNKKLNERLNEARAMDLRARRKKIQAIFESKSVQKADMLYAYFGGNPKLTRHERPKPVLSIPMPKDPRLLEHSFPHRMVECRLCPDLRQRYGSDDLENPMETVKAPDEESFPSTTLFLQRTMLTEPYEESDSCYSCNTCGRKYGSMLGLQYHTKANVCVGQCDLKCQKRAEREQRIEKGANSILRGDFPADYYIPRQIGRPETKTTRTAKTAAATTSRRKPGDPPKKRLRRKKVLGLYPEVLISLGFEVVKKDMKFTDDMPLPPLPTEATSDENGVVLLDSDDEVAESRSAADGPQAVLENLKRELIAENQQFELSSADSKFGAMYPGVFRALEFKKARTRTVDTLRSAKRPRRTQKAAPAKPLPPAIDTQALVDEVDSGRYPSMKRYKGDEHEDYCSLCREGGDSLFLCEFCRKVEHLGCLRLKYTVKNPEPKDDFMCHACISKIVHRRQRAEKRRLEKKNLDEQRKQRKILEEMERNPGLIEGMEYPYMAAKGQHVSELIVLMEDARNRLKQSLATAKMNDIRRRMMV